MVTCVGDTIVIIIQIIHVGDAIIVIVQVNGVVNTVGIRVTGLEQATLGIFSPLMPDIRTVHARNGTISSNQGIRNRSFETTDLGPEDADDEDEDGGTEKEEGEAGSHGAQEAAGGCRRLTGGCRW